MAGNSAIWRATSTGPEGSNGSDIIEFDSGAVPNATGHISTTEIEYDIEPAENEKAKGNMNELQYVGVQGSTVIVTGHIQTPSSITLTTILKKWAFETQVNTTFPKGRFGLRMDDNPINNLTPVAGLGYLLANLRLIRPVEFQGKLDFIARLRLNGNPVTTDFDWS